MSHSPRLFFVALTLVLSFTMVGCAFAHGGGHYYRNYDCRGGGPANYDAAYNDYHGRDYGHRYYRDDNRRNYRQGRSDSNLVPRREYNDDRGYNGPDNRRNNE